MSKFLALLCLHHSCVTCSTNTKIQAMKLTHNFYFRNLRPIDRMCAPTVTSWKKSNTYATSADKPIQSTASWYFHHLCVFSATRSHFVMVSKRFTSLVHFCLHLGSSEMLYTNRKSTSMHICYYENLNRDPWPFSFSVSPGFANTHRLLEVNFRFSNGGGRVTVWVGKAFKQVYWCVSSSYIPCLKLIFIVQRFFVMNYYLHFRKCSDWFSLVVSSGSIS
jgi:hypothetical protein